MPLAITDKTLKQTTKCQINFQFQLLINEKRGTDKTDNHRASKHV